MEGDGESMAAEFADSAYATIAALAARSGLFLSSCSVKGASGTGAGAGATTGAGASCFLAAGGAAFLGAAESKDLVAAIDFYFNSKSDSYPVSDSLLTTSAA